MSNPYDPNQPQNQPWGTPPPPPGAYSNTGNFPPPQGPWYPQNPQDIPPQHQALVQPKKPWSIGKKIGVAIGSAIVVIAALNAGGGDDDSDDDSLGTTIVSTTDAEAQSAGLFGTSDTASVKLGDTVKVDQGDATAAVTVSNLRVGADQMWATDGGTIYDVDVTFVCESGTFKVNPFYFEARSTAGKTLNAAIGGDLGATDCLAGETVTGTVGFNIAPGDSISKITLQGILLDRLADWTV